MTLTALCTEALALAWGVHVKAATWEEVVSWADEWILRLDAPPEELLDLSLSGGRPNEVFSQLQMLAQQGDPEAALSALVQRLYDDVTDGQICALMLAAHLADVADLSSSEVPDDVRLPPAPHDFHDAAWLLYSIWVERDSEDVEDAFNRNLVEEVLATLRRFR